MQVERHHEACRVVAYVVARLELDAHGHGRAVAVAAVENLRRATWAKRLAKPESLPRNGRPSHSRKLADSSPYISFGVVEFAKGALAIAGRFWRVAAGVPQGSLASSIAESARFSLDRADIKLLE